MEPKNEHSGANFTMTNPLSNALKGGKKLDDQKFIDADEMFNQKMIEAENRIRREERETLTQMQSTRIEGIVI
ncbi:MAG: hypothetical protein WC089_01250 [Candidatus Paceibacterota bacterium]